MYNTFWRHAFFVRGQSFSVKTFDRSRNSCQVIREGAGTIFGGLPCRRYLSPRLSPSRAPVFSCAHYFQAPAMQARLPAYAVPDLDLEIKGGGSGGGGPAARSKERQLYSQGTKLLALAITSGGQRRLFVNVIVIFNATLE